MKWGKRDMYVSRIAHKYRTELMMEHFDLKYEDVKDPISGDNYYRKIAD